MRKHIITLAVVAAIGVFGVSAVEAQRGGPGGGPGARRPGLGGPTRAGGGPGAIVRGLRQLELTDAQKSQVRDIMSQARADMAPLMQQVRATRQEVRSAIQSGATPATARSEALAALADVRKQLAEARQKTRAAIEGVLTPEQVEKLKTLRGNRGRRV